MVPSTFGSDSLFLLGKSLGTDRIVPIFPLASSSLTEALLFFIPARFQWVGKLPHQTVHLQGCGCNWGTWPIQTFVPVPCTWSSTQRLQAWPPPGSCWPHCQVQAFDQRWTTADLCCCANCFGYVHWKGIYCRNNLFHDPLSYFHLHLHPIYFGLVQPFASKTDQDWSSVADNLLSYWPQPIILCLNVWLHCSWSVIVSPNSEFEMWNSRWKS